MPVVLAPVAGLADRHLGGRIADRAGHLRVDHAELGVDRRGRRLDPGQRDDHGERDPLAADRAEVGQGALRLGAPQRVGRHPDLAHRVVLDPEPGVFLGGHCPGPPIVSSGCLGAVTSA